MWTVFIYANHIQRILLLLKIKNALNMTSGMNYIWSNVGFLKQKKFTKMNSEDLAKY